MRSSNIFIKNHFEIHFEEKFIVVKDIPNRHYLRFSGHSMDIISEQIGTPDFELTLEKVFSSRTYPGNKRIISFAYTDSRILKEGISKIPDFLFRLPVLVLTILFGLLLGLFLLIHITRKEAYPYWIYVLWTVINIVAHELGHVVLCIKSGRTVQSFGIKLNYYLPMMYIDTSDICMSSMRWKIATSLGGVYFNSFLCIATALLYLGSNISFICCLSGISLFFIISNLIPFLKLDGYYVLSDWMNIGNLNGASKKAFQKRLHGKQGLCEHDRVLVLYFLAKNLFLLAIVISVINRVL